MLTRIYVVTSWSQGERRDENRFVSKAANGGENVRTGLKISDNGPRIRRMGLWKKREAYKIVKVVHRSFSVNLSEVSIGAEANQNIR